MAEALSAVQHKVVALDLSSIGGSALTDPTIGVPKSDSVDEIGDVAIDYGVYGAPEAFLIGPDGTILDKHPGPLNAAIWQEDFVPLIEAGGPSS